MRSTPVIVLGAGQAGLAMSWHLTDRSIDHVVLERGTAANSWRTERWDSLRLLTPNWLSRLPGWSYRGEDPNGFMTAHDVARHLDGFRRSFDAPVQANTTVEAVTTTADGFRVDTDRGPWTTAAVVVATGACSTPKIPAIATALPAHVNQTTPIEYRNPAGIASGEVLVVGASASGTQIASELAEAGRSVTIAVGEHTRLPRRYRGRDIHWWMDAIGQLDERYDDVDDIVRARRLPSLQLIGSPSHRSLGLNELRAGGVELVGRLVGTTHTKLQFSGSFANVCAAADLKQNRLLDLIDEFADLHELNDEITAPDRPEPTAVPSPPTELDLTRFEHVVWATGFRPVYPWLEPHVLDRKGHIVHDGGVMTQPGMYVIGLPFMRRRKSSFLDGVGPDAHDLSAHLTAYLDGRASARPARSYGASESIQATASR